MKDNQFPGHSNPPDPPDPLNPPENRVVVYMPDFPPEIFNNVTVDIKENGDRLIISNDTGEIVGIFPVSSAVLILPQNNS
jgi:hypothetical protein